MSNCVFCNIETERILNKYNYFITFRDLYPVTDLHTLIVPKRHAVSYFELRDDELIELAKIIKYQKNELTNLDKTISGFNIGMNIGEDAGQTVFHCHVHIIPRRKGDVKNPRGGIRGVIPDKKSY
jgi:ATP adenylyltransferase